ncbi:hypothetical protein MFLAVUS_000924 [Mucor flavus]|uniref:Uncharacterized protein n=1 Tax=Mucor flavus TaxID=439312 RepID=A0ABP9YL49_9FUNG
MTGESSNPITKRPRLKPPPPSSSPSPSPPPSSSSGSPSGEFAGSSAPPPANPQIILQKDIFREIAENHTIARRDTLNFGLLTVIQYLENEQLNLQNNYARDMTTFRYVQTYMLNFSEQLNLTQAQLNEMQAILAAATNPIVQTMSNTINTLIIHLNNKRQDSQRITEDIGNLLVRVGEFDNNFLVNEINSNVLNITLNVKVIEKRCLTRIATSRDILVLISGIGPLYRRVRNQLLLDILNQLPNNTRPVINTAINHQTDIRNVNNMIGRLNQAIAVAANNNERIQLIQSIIVMLANIDIVNERYRNFVTNNANISNENITQNYFAQYNGLQIEQNCTTQLQRLIEQSTAIETNLNNILQPFAEVFPAITTSIFRSHAYRKICHNTMDINNLIVFEDCIQNNIDEFNDMRQIQDNGEGSYTIPVLDNMHVGLSETGRGTTIQTNQAAGGIVSYQTFSENRITTNTPGFQDIYDRVKVIYNSEFGTTPFEDLNNYEYARQNPLKFIQLSYRLLQESSAHDNWQTKRWGLLPCVSHAIINFRITGPKSVYGLFVIAYHKNLAGFGPYHIPPILQFGNRLIYFHQFLELYRVFEVKQQLWVDLFNIDKLQKNQVLDESNVMNLEHDNSKHTRFSFSLQTDGHMVSALSEKVKTFWNLLKNQDIKLRRRNKNLQNVNTGIYPLYKNPTRIFSTDHIIGIDPGIVIFK